MPEHHPSSDHSRAESSVPHILDMAQRALDLPPKVEARKQTLVEEVLTLCKKYGFSHPNELATSPDTSHIPLSDLELLADLMSKLEYIVKHRELPKEEELECIDDQEYTIELPKGANVSEIFDDHGRPIIIGSLSSGLDFVQDQTGKLIPLDEERNVELALCQGKPVIVQYRGDIFSKDTFTFCDFQGLPVGDLTMQFFQARIKNQQIKEVSYKKVEGEDGLDYYLVRPIDKDGKMIGRKEGYYDTQSLVTVGSHYYFIGKETSSSTKAVYNEEGDQVNEDEYDDILFLLNMGGKLVLSVRKEHRQWFVYPDGSFVPGESPMGFREAQNAQEVNGKIYFWERTKHRLSSYIFCDHTGKEFGKTILNFVPVAWRVVGDTLYYLNTSMSESCYIEYMPSGGMFLRLGYGQVLPILVGETLVSIFSTGVLSPVSLTLGDVHYTQETFDDVHVLEPIDDHHFYVIAQKEGKILKRVFTV